jgi:lysophospholipase L1-like esterase
VLLVPLSGARAVAELPLKIVCLGDSVTKGERPGVKADETFCVVLEKKLLKADPKAQVINAGIGGHTTLNALARFERDVLAVKPTHVVIMFGLNDSWIDKDRTEPRLSPAEFAGNLKKMVGSLKERKVTVLLLTPNPVIAPKYGPDRNANLKKYVTEVRRLAREERVTLVDVYARFGELPLEGTDLNTLFTDAMHPNPKGHELLADLLFDELTSIPR